MSLSIGVVNINYLEQPGPPVYGFMQALMENPEVGLGDDRDDAVDGYWDGGSGENAFCEFSREGLANRANGWATEQGLRPAAGEVLLNWLERLPYRDDNTVMLHLSF